MTKQVFDHDIDQEQGDDADKERDRTITLLHISPEDYINQANLPPLPEGARSETLNTLWTWIEDTVETLRDEFPNYHVSSRQVDTLGPFHQWILDVEPDNDLIITQAYRVANELWRLELADFIRKMRRFL